MIELTIELILGSCSQGSTSHISRNRHPLVPVSVSVPVTVGDAKDCFRIRLRPMMQHEEAKSRSRKSEHKNPLSTACLQPLP